MKIIRNIFGLIILLLFAGGCAQKQSASEMLQDSTRQKEVFNAISNDSTQMRQFMQYMKQNGKGMHMMNNRHMMSSMMENREMMMNMMQSDTSMCKKMMDNMMAMARDSAMCKMMCKQMMANKNMKDRMMKDGMMCPMHEEKTGEMKKEPKK